MIRQFGGERRRMTKQVSICLVACELLAVWLAASALPAEAADRDALGEADKYRILVVTRGTVPIPGSRVGGNPLRKSIAEDVFSMAATDRFNVIGCSAKAPFDLDRVRREANWAQKHGISYVCWLRGKTAAGAGPKYTWHDGTLQNEASPNSDVFWSFLTERIIGYAKVSRENPTLIGTFVDFENYHAPRSGTGTLYTLSYDNEILARFAKSEGIALPNSLPKQRKTWLEAKKLHDAFAAYQVALWRQRCRKLRGAVDEINPRFQIVCCPGEGRSDFLIRAFYRELSTRQAPLVIATEGTYGRATNLTPQEIALDANRKHVEDGVAFFKTQKIPFQFLGGIDPIVRGADPEFCARNAVAISQPSSGYWVFNEGPAFGTPAQKSYREWFARANAALKSGNYAFQNAKRVTAHPMIGIYPGMKLKPFTAAAMPANAANKTPLIQFGQTTVVLLRAGEELRARIEAVELRKNRPPVEYLVVGPDGNELEYGNVVPCTTKAIAVEAQTDGLHVIAVGAGKLGTRVSVENQYACTVISRKQLTLYGNHPDLYFVPLAAEEAVVVDLELECPWFGSSVGKVELVASGPDGSEALRQQVLPKRIHQIRIPVPASQTGRAWRISLTESRKGELLRVSHLTFIRGSGDFVATHPTRLLVPAGQK
jgi:hypothetical protein